MIYHSRAITSGQAGNSKRPKATKDFVSELIGFIGVTLVPVDFSNRHIGTL